MMDVSEIRRGCKETISRVRILLILLIFCFHSKNAANNGQQNVLRLKRKISCWSSNLPVVTNVDRFSLSGNNKVQF